MWLAEVLEPEPRKLRSAFGLWAIVAAVGLVLILTLSVLVSVRRSKRLRGGVKARRRRGKPIPNAWEEAGRRVMPIRMDEPPPEVLPEDRP